MEIAGNEIDGRTRAAREMEQVASECTAMNQAAERRKLELRAEEMQQRILREVEGLRSEVAGLSQRVAELEAKSSADGNRGTIEETSSGADEMVYAQGINPDALIPPAADGMIYSQEINPDALRNRPGTRRR